MNLSAFLALAILPAASPPPDARPAPAGKPNVVIILADDLGWADAACYGGDLHETPEIDRLARQAVRFTHAYAASPVCSPTRASIMTGKSPARLHMTTWREAAEHPSRNRELLPPVTVANLPHSEVTLARVLQRAGYLTALVGKWHLGDAAHYPETHGFDINIVGNPRPFGRRPAERRARRPQPGAARARPRRPAGSRGPVLPFSPLLRDHRAGQLGPGPRLEIAGVPW
jgi:arylsulfatase A-like enzyme